MISFSQNRQTLITTILEMERQDAFTHFALAEHLKRLEALVKQQHDMMNVKEQINARNALLKLLLSEEELAEITKDKLIDQWHDEFKNVSLKNPTDNQSDGGIHS